MAYKVSEAPAEEGQLARRAATLLPALLPQGTVLETRMDVEAGAVRLDLQAKVKVGNVTKVLLCDVKAKGEPKYLLGAIGQLTLAAKQFPDAYPVVVVPSLSREGRNILRKAEVGWLTLDGEACLEFDTVFIERFPIPQSVEELTQSRLGEPKQGRQPKATLEAVRALLKERKSLPKRQRRLPMPFSPRSSRILRALLERPGQLCRLRDLAAEAGVALRSAELTVAKLDEKGFIERGEESIRLLKPKELLEAWATVYKFREANQFSYYYSLARNFEELTGKLRSLPEGLRDSYRLTLYAGASLVAPQMRFNDVHLYVKGDPAEWAKLLDLSPVDSGANAALINPFDLGVFDYPQEKQGVMVVSNTQLYLDLVNLNDRARDQAEVLFQQSMARPEPGSLGERIKKARLERMGTRGTMTRQGLADFVGVSADKIAAWEENELVPTREELILLAKWLRRPVEYFKIRRNPA